MRAGAGGATVLRYELRRGDSKAAADTAALLEHPIDLDPGQPCLMRADRVDFALDIALEKCSRACAASSSGSRASAPTAVGR